MTTAALLKAQAHIDPKKTYKGIAFFKDQKPRDFIGSVLLQELKSLKNSLSDSDVDKLIGGLSSDATGSAQAETPKSAAKTEKPKTEKPAAATSESES